MQGLSVIIISFNTKEMTVRCVNAVLHSLKKSKIPYEIIIVDNHSQDGSVKALGMLTNGNIRLVLNTENVGYGKANNQALRIARYSHVLYLNSDVVVEDPIDFSVLLQQFEEDPKLGALTVRVNLPDGKMDMASHRGFPTLWRAICYFSGMEKLFGWIPVLDNLFGGYHLTSKGLTSRHEIDSPTGAFYLAKRDILEQLDGFDETFFMYGEDLDLSYRIKEHGYTIVYDPSFTVVHYKYQSGLKNGNDKNIRKRIRQYFYESMQIFYRKHFEIKYPKLVSKLVYFIISAKSR